MSGNIALETQSISVNETAGSVLVPIVRTGDLSQSVEITYEATFLNVPDAADAADFTPIYSTVTMDAGDDRIVVPIEILDDDVSENTESFSFALVVVDSGSLLFPRTVQIDILDDENPIDEPTAPPLEANYTFEEEIVVSNLTKPIAFEFSPFDPSIVYIAEKNGKIRLFDLDDGSDLGDVLDIMDQVNQRGDRGLMDIALHPDLESNPYIYTYYTVDPPDTAGKSGDAAPDGEGNRFAYLTRHTLDADNGYRTVVPGSEVILVGAAGQSLNDISGNGAINSTSDFDAPPSDVDQETGEYVQDYIKVDSLSHAGGSVEFGPDGALYVSTGDGTSYNAMDVRTLSVQSVHALAGKILRLDPISGDGLADNPFVDEAGGDLTLNAAKVYQLGLRNPFTMSFDDEGRLLIAEVGWGLYEEINTGGPGANFGWPFYEGGDGGILLETRNYKDLDEAQAFYDAVEAGDIVVTPAFKAFSHREVDPGFQVQALIGANDVIYSDRYPEDLQGRYLFSDISQGEVFAINVNDRRDVEFIAKNDGAGPVHLKMGPDGYMYFAYLTDNTITRVFLSELGSSGPIAGDDNATTQEEQSVVIDVLANDSDPDGDPVSIASVTQGSNGSVSINSDGTLTYSPAGGFTGTDTFTYEITSTGGLDTGRVTVSVKGIGSGELPDFARNGTSGNDTLKGGGSSDSINGRAGNDYILGRGAEDLLAGGSGDDFVKAGASNDTLIYVIGDNIGSQDSYEGSAGVDLLQIYGTAEELADPGLLSDISALEAFMASNYDTSVNGGPTFNFSSIGLSVRSMESVELIQLGGSTEPPPAPPTATDDVFDGPEDGELSGNVLDNDLPAEGGALSAQLVEGPEHGVLALQSNGGFTYSPEVDFFGADSFVYRAVEGGQSATAVVTLNVEAQPDPPTAVDDTASTQQGQPVVIDVLVNDNDPDGDPLSVASVAQGGNGSVSENADGTVTYTPNAEFFGTDSFTYVVASNGGSDTGEVIVTVSEAGGGGGEEGSVPEFDRLGTPGNDTLKGGGNADSINGLGGDDYILGRGAEDILAGGPGDDFVKAGALNDTLVYVIGDNTGSQDAYEGSAGVDLLQIYGTSGELSDADFLADIAALETFMSDNYDTGRNGGPTFEFESLGLSVRSMETVELIVIGDDPV
ncbi:Ig-like domain-containing protein [Tropicimonas marinistellae]|uniref:Ig-like domain-containing protein n=1 Tax=Tropicimonas marinistellae TaxID=1739787 RepID=UPI00082AB7D4|nr:Ig-like domain-containing protein [Tropicimonas marinistellae]